MAYTHILAALGAPDADELLLTRAQTLAQQLGARLSVLHVVAAVTPMPGFDGGLGIGAELSVTDQLLIADVQAAHAHARLQGLCAKLGLPADCVRIGVGPSAAEILSIAAEAGADLIVVGHHPHRGLSALFSHTEAAVVKGARCDVLAIALDAAAS